MIILLVALFLFILLQLIQTWFIFNPSKDILIKPEESYEDCYIDDGKIHSWYFINNSSESATVLLFCHGNTGNISERDYIIKVCKQYNINLFLFDYPGYGLSCGEPNQQNICQAGESAYFHLRKHYLAENIICWGESLGGAVSTWIASRYKCKALVLFSTFSSLAELVRSPFNDIVETFFDCLPIKDWISNVTCPIAIIHSKEDTKINYKCAQFNYDRISCTTTKQFFEICGDHATPIIDVSQVDELFEFVGCGKGNKK